MIRSGRESIELPELTDGASFHLNRFDHTCFFSGYLFPIAVTFSSAKFSRVAVFASVIFRRIASFGSTTFDEGAYFASATFGDSAAFRSALFSQFANFEETTFCNTINFEKAKFNGNAHFRSAKFGGNANYIWGTNFEFATFSERADFQSTTFTGGAKFRWTRFRADAGFQSATFNGDTFFDGAVFDFDASFINTSFFSVTHFSGTTFYSKVPKFFGATLHEGTVWNGVEWPPPPPNYRDGYVKKRGAQEQVFAYERLKQEMEKLKKHEDEQFFFRKELRARRELYTRRETYWWLNFLYEKLSNYGYGVVRPLVAFAALFLVGFVLLALDPFGFAGKKLTLWDAAFTSFANMFGSLPVKILADYADNNKCAYTAEIFAIFQTIAGAVLLFLFFLALRNRFRLR